MTGTPSDPARPELPAQYVPAAIEDRRYELWEQLGCFRADPTSSKPPFSVVIPPPNVTGNLHMGHAYEHTHIDAITRRKRMQGFETLWLPGTDHAGIATQSVVERALAAEGTSRAALGREAFVERVWEWKETYGGNILGQMRRLGDGVDWSRTRFTLDEGLSLAVRTIFKRLFDDGLIYRAERLVNWSPVLHTAISDIEVDYRDVDGELVTLDYGSGVHVATTRVETMLGDTAVAVHPDDPRYAHLVGTFLTLPIVGRRIPVVADAHVDPEFGTGAVKVTPAHDPNDFEIGQRHGLEAVTVLDADARVTGTGTRFDGMDRYEARRAVKEELHGLGLVVAEKTPYVHSVGHSSRSGEAIEPRLSLQWYVKVAPLAKAAGDAVRSGATRFSPPDMAKRYFDWVDDMHDWCISRQLWWGHRIPIWYGPNGEVVCPAPGDEPTGEGWTQDPDVLDTWFSSALWPMSTLGWPRDTPDLRRFYPTSVLVTGYDIIFFWVARMMMFCTYGDAEHRPPFGTVVVHGLVRDARGKKMSKSAGNVIDPLAWIETYGADPLRLALARGANPGTDFPLSEEAVVGARNFCTKVWNAVRFALLNGADAAAVLPPADELSVLDRWILSRLATVTAEVDALFEEYEFAKICDALGHLARDEVFDWYVELLKPVLRDGGPAADASRAVLGRVLDTLLRLFHPVIPFVTDELWCALTGRETVVTAPWPTTPADGAPLVDPGWVDPAAEAEVGRLQDLVTEVRRFRGEQGLATGKKVGAVLLVDDPAAALRGYAAQLGALADLTVTLADAVPEGWPTLEAAGARVALDLSAAVDVGAERARLTKERGEAEKEITRTRAKLASTAFTAKAPAAVVEKTHARLAEAEAEVVRLKARLAALDGA